MSSGGQGGSVDGRVHPVSRSLAYRLGAAFLAVLGVIFMGSDAQAATAAGGWVGGDNVVNGSGFTVTITPTTWPGPGVVNGDTSFQLVRSGGTTSTTINYEFWCVGNTSVPIVSGNRSSITTTTLTISPPAGTCVGGVDYVTFSDAAFGGERIKYAFDSGDGADDTASCSFGTVTGLRASVVDGKWWATWRYFGSEYTHTLDGSRSPSQDGSLGKAASWRVRIDGAVQYSGSAIVVSGSPGWRYTMTAPATITGSPASTADLKLSIYNGQKNLCVLTAATSSTLIEPGPLSSSSSGGPGDYGPADDGDGNSCSAFDIFCRIKGALVWAFQPEAATVDQFQSLGGDLETKIPFVYVTGAFTFLDYNLPACEMPCTAQGSYGELFSTPEFETSYVDIPSIDVAPADSGFVVWMRDNRSTISVVMWLLLLIPLGFWIWRRLMPVAGSGSQ